MLNKTYRLLYLALAVAFMAFSCSKGHNESQRTDFSEHVFETSYAKGFKLSEGPEGVRYLTISDPQQENTSVYRYALIDRGSSIDRSSIPECYTILETPVDRIICMTSLQLSNFITLGETEKIVGITSTRHLFNDEINHRLSTGHTSKIGIEGSFDAETVMAIEPQLILISPFKRGGYDSLRECGVPLMPHLGYKETTPLGQAEWLKLVGILVGNDEKAVDIFDGIAKRYDSLRTLVDDVRLRPTVMSGEFRGGHWYAPGGESFLANLIRDAGGSYFLDGDESSGGVTLDFETVYAKAEDADYWRIVNSYEGDFDYQALAAQEPRYGDFKAFRNHGIIYCNMRTTPFYERMPMEPDKVLEDLISILHPDSISVESPEFYTRLP